MTTFNVRSPNVGKLKTTGGGSVEQAFISLVRVFEEVDDELFNCLDKIGGKILAEAQENAPLDTGALRESGTVRINEFTTRFQLEVGFGGPTRQVSPTRNAPMGWVDYAFEIHENLERSFDVGGPKFLELAFYNNIEFAKSAITKCVKDAVARGA